jgi:hypothetical protein
LGLKYWEEPLIQGELSTIAPGGHDPLFAEKNHKHHQDVFQFSINFLHNRVSISFTEIQQYFGCCKLNFPHYFKVKENGYQKNI